MKAIYRGLSVSFFALVAAGCATPNPTPMDKPGDVPGNFTAPVADKQAPIWPEANWWVNFKADELPAMMDIGEKENLDLAAAAARVIEAEAEDGEAFANILPVVNAQGSATAPARILRLPFRPVRRSPATTSPLAWPLPIKWISGASSATSYIRRAKICAPPAMPRPWSA